MKKKSDIEVIENDFNQKKVNHIVHYLDNFDTLLKILKDGFAPSYCLEIINEIDYYIPMTSFCNIPLKDVDLYMRYGKYGIGMSLDWALKNSISPVIYIHETTPFKELHSRINKIHLHKMFQKIFNNRKFEDLDNIIENFDYSEYEKTFKEISNITVPALQFFKNWKTTYKGKEIITYHEREWRYIPRLENQNLLLSDEFKDLKKSIFAKKPHLPQFTLSLTSIEDIRYVLIKDEIQRKKVLRVLRTKFGENVVVDSILSGKLMIITEDLIKNDF